MDGFFPVVCCCRVYTRVRGFVFFFFSRYTAIVKHAASDYYSGVLIPTQFHKKKIVRACSMFHPYEGYRSVTPLDAARVNRTNLKNEAEHV